MGFAGEDGLVREVSYQDPLPVTSWPGGRAVSKAVTFAALTTGAVAAHDLFTVTGHVVMKIYAVCTVDVTGSGTIEVGTAGNTAALIPQTTGSAIDAGEIWYDNSPDAGTIVASSITDRIVVADVIYTVATDTLTGGTITFYAYWQPLDSTGSVVAA